MSFDIWRIIKKNRMEVASFLFVIFLLVVGLLLRTGDLGNFNVSGRDETAWLFIGTSLLEDGVPTSWSMEKYFEFLESTEVVMCKKVVTPFLGHPPLFALVIGVWARLVNEVNWCVIDWSLVRVPMIVITMATIVVTWLFVRKVYGGLLAGFVLLAFVFFPSHVVTSRSVAAEHLIGLFLMLSLYLFAVYESTRILWKKRVLAAALFLMGVASPLSKLNGVLVPATIVLLSLMRRKFGLSLLIILSAVVSLSLFFLYGAYYNWEAFMNYMASNYDRTQSFAHFWTLFTKLDVGKFSFYDPSVIVGLIGAIWLSATHRKRRGGEYMFSALFAASFVFLYVAPVEAYGWYKYLLYPVIAVGLGYVFYSLFNNRLVFLILFLPLLSMMLEKSMILNEVIEQREVMVLFYGLILPFVVINKGIFKLRYWFLIFLVLLLITEVFWVSRVLGYITG